MKPWQTCGLRSSWTQLRDVEDGNVWKEESGTSSQDVAGCHVCCLCSTNTLNTGMRVTGTQVRTRGKNHRGAFTFHAWRVFRCANATEPIRVWNMFILFPPITSNVSLQYVSLICNIIFIPFICIMGYELHIEAVPDAQTSKQGHRPLNERSPWFGQRHRSHTCAPVMCIPHYTRHSEWNLSSVKWSKCTRSTE